MNFDLLQNFFTKALAPLRRKVALMVGRAVISAVKDGQAIQLVQADLLAEEVKDEIERFQEFGFRSHPPVGTEAVMVCVGGNRDHGVIVATVHRESFDQLPSLGEGNAMLFNSVGKYVHLKDNDLRILLSKLVINNDSHEMVAVVAEFMRRVIEGKVITAIGPQPWTPETVLLLEETEEKFLTFKE